MSKATRKEKDLLGEREVPSDAYWGIHTLRAQENFRLGGRPVDPGLVRALALVKLACCRANAELGFLDARKAEAIGKAAREVADGGLAGEFPVDALQGGAGTSTNMNVNEVLANRACELLGGAKGDSSLVHPIEHVNLHQSTNDVYPTALKVACILGLREVAARAEALQGALQRKEKEFARVVKIGRTELVEAVPMTLGMEFSAYAEALGRDRWRTFKCEERLRVVNLGGTSVGTGLSAPRDYIFLATERLRELTGLGLARGENLVAETAGADPFVEVSGILKAHAATLLKMSSDMRLLALLGEIRLPALQAGSSAMPGKVNPVMLEAASQAALKVFAGDLLVSEVVSRSHLQIHELLPLAASALLESLGLLAAADRDLAAHVDGIEADERRCRENLDRSPGLLTAFVPSLGYERCTALSREFREKGEAKDVPLRAFLEERLGAETVARTLSPENLASLGHRTPAPGGRPEAA